MSAKTSRKSRSLVRSLCRAGAAIGLALSATASHAAATIVINNINAPGVGFNDTTPATPVGGNPGTTIGQQRLFAFSYAANLWGATLTSTQPIVINAQFSALSCTATSATLGSAGATSIFRNFANAPIADAWYSYALANKLAGAYLGTPNAPQINANFNVNLGAANCLAGSPFYLGTDGNHGTAVDFVEVLLHEMGHGLGFQTFTSGATGAQNGGFPSVWDFFLLETTTNRTWNQLTNAERAASAIRPQQLVWTGAGVTAAVPSVLQAGVPQLAVKGPASVAGSYLVGTASFGPALSTAAVSGQIMPVVDQSDGVTGLACDPLNAKNAAAVVGKLALVDRGVCGFTVKVANLQAAGAIGAIIADNAAGSPPPGLGGADPTITIPAVRITVTDGAKLKGALQTRSRTASTLTGRLDLDLTRRAGADAFNRVFLYTPNPFISGSSVSHFDVSASPNLLMEPNINDDLTQNVNPPRDLTFPLLRDTGW